jgi:thiamine biosynthesis lipoprotein
MAMGTFASVEARGDDPARLSEYAALAGTALEELEDSLSLFRPLSEIARLNRAAGQTAVPVSVRTAELLGLSLRYARQTGGAFDPTVGPLVERWGFHGRTPPTHPLTAEEARAALAQIGFWHLTVSNGMAFLDQPGMTFDPGGIAKGYAVDVCFERLKAAGARDFMVNLGGNIRCSGGTWRVGVRNPLNGDELVGTLRLANGMAVATSGNYEQFVILDGERYAHILDPHTGFPVRGMAGVTVVSTSAVETDALSTGLFVLGVEKGAELLAGFPDSHALFIPDERPLRIYVTAGLRRLFDPLPAFVNAVVPL